MNLNLNFEACNDKKGDNYVKRHLGEICQEILFALGENSVKSIILTGSLARKEGSVIFHGERVEIFSDYDLIVHSKRVTQKIRRKLGNLAKRLTDKFSKEGLVSHVEIVPISTHTLSNMTSCMFALELKKHGRSLYGEDHRKTMPDLKATDIQQKDSLKMLHNRIAGVLACFDPAIFLRMEKRDLSLAKLLIYHIAKNYVDMGSSLLSFKKMYVCSYRERVGVLKENFKQFDFSANHLHLPETVEKWTEFKLNPDIEGLLKENGYDTPTYENIVALGREMWFDHIGYLQALWQYEINNMYNTEEIEIPALLDVFFEDNNTLREKILGCYRYIARKPTDVPLLTLLSGCLKSIKGSALAPAVYSLSNYIFFYSHAMLNDNLSPLKTGFVKYMARLPIHLSLNQDNSQVWESARRDTVLLWQRFVC